MAKQTFTKEDIFRFADEENVRYLRLQFTDILGTIKNVEVPIAQLEKVLNNEMMFDGSSIEGFVRIEESDMYLCPDLDTWVIFPWTAGKGKVARLICDIYNPDGKPFPGDPRTNLKRVLKEMEELGFTDFNLGPEPEFFLFKLDEKGEPTLELNDNGGYFDLAPTDLGENCRRDIVLELEDMGFDIEASHHEVAPGQHEIDFKYADAITACDNIQTFKLVVKTIARKHNLHATFMPKPLFGVNGSGMHFNVSLFKGKENAFFIKDKAFKDKAIDNELQMIEKEEFIKKLPGYTEQKLTLDIMSYFLFAISAFIIGIFLYVITIQKEPIFGLLKAQGISNGFLAKSLLIQTLILSLIAVLIALVLTIATAMVIPDIVPIKFEWDKIAVFGLTIMITAIIGGLFSIRSIRKVDPLKTIE